MYKKPNLISTVLNQFCLSVASTVLYIEEQKGPLSENGTVQFQNAKLQRKMNTNTFHQSIVSDISVIPSIQINTTPAHGMNLEQFSESGDVLCTMCGHLYTME